MTNTAGQGPSKTHREENFPVASRLINERHRATILAFYRFARAADDVADNPSLSESEKFALLDSLEHTLTGKSEIAAEALPLRAAIAERGLSTRHPLDLLTAFRMDVTKRRYRDWDDLIGYCTVSAMPVGRFVLDVHGESRDTWAASDPLCAALQIINHLQDCGQDYRRLDRVYIPLDAFARHGAEVTDLGAAKATPGLLACVGDLADRTSALLDDARPLYAEVADLRLGLEIAVIQKLAITLRRMLTQRDPLSEKVHLSKAGVGGIGALAISEGLIRRFVKARFAYRKAQDA
ncbi:MULTISPECIES: squalene synthase HpnC [Rhodomicrobium]|uniref:squalene synthase HpnC n=1 Tax=Rhodomicrobium TaxID=1068 RepID=UPI000B4BCC3F|nr:MULTISPECIES: squalene synthase HpnC [Rhodomicrobium]